MLAARWDDREQSPWAQAVPRWPNLLLRLSLRKSELLRLLSHVVVQVTKKLAEHARPHDDAAARWTPPASPGELNGYASLQFYAAPIVLAIAARGSVRPAPSFDSVSAAGSCNTVAHCPRHKRVSSTTFPLGNSRAS